MNMNQYTSFHVYKKIGDNDEILYNKTSRNLNDKFTSDEYWILASQKPTSEAAKHITTVSIMPAGK